MTNDSQIITRLPHSLKEKLLKIARQTKVTPAEINRRALSEYLSQPCGYTKVDNFAGPYVCEKPRPCKDHPVHARA